MIIKTKQQAADQGTHGPILLAAWEAGETRVKVGGKEYELVREVEPVEMWTGHALIAELSKAFPEHATVLASLANVFIDATSLILARRVEMLRAMMSDDLVDEVSGRLSALPNPARSAVELLTLITEHIEANRPELTNEIVSGWYGEFCEKSARRFSVDDACQYVAHRAAEYRSNTDALRVKHGTELGALDAEHKKRVAEFNAVTSACAAEVKELRAENERLNAQCERLAAGTYSAGDLVTQRDDANLRLAAENLELRAENEHLKRRMDVVLHAGPASAIAAHVFDRASKLELELADLRAKLTAEFSQSQEYFTELSRVNAENERLKKAWENHSKIDVELRRKVNVLEDALSMARSPQPVDDSDKYGILVQDGCVALVHRLPRGWATEYYISGSNVIIDPARIFKVTSQPRGPLKVPSEGDIEDMTFEEIGRIQSLRAGARWAVKWIKKANGAE